MPIFCKRGSVFVIQFTPPNDPTKPIEKLVVCLQEGKIVESSDDFVAVLTTTRKLDSIYPWDVFVSPEESHSVEGIKVQCNKIHTLSKSCIKEHAYDLSDSTMKEIDRKLLLGIGIAKFERDIQPPS